MHNECKVPRQVNKAYLKVPALLTKLKQFSVNLYMYAASVNH